MAQRAVRELPRRGRIPRDAAYRQARPADLLRHARDNEGLIRATSQAAWAATPREQPALQLRHLLGEDRAWGEEGYETSCEACSREELIRQIICLSCRFYVSQLSQMFCISPQPRDDAIVEHICLLACCVLHSQLLLLTQVLLCSRVDALYCNFSTDRPYDELCKHNLTVTFS